MKSKLCETFVRTKDTVFTMGGTVPFLFPIPNFLDLHLAVLLEKMKIGKVYKISNSENGSYCDFFLSEKRKLKVFFNVYVLSFKFLV